jgi:type II secretory ATPase GspE/PulE/Tfp pilus assembly ATPase PilB-like protein
MNGPLKVLQSQSFESFLIDRHILSDDLLHVVRREMHKEQLSLEKILLSLHLISEKQLTQLLSDFSTFPLIDLTGQLPPLLRELSPFLSKELLSRPTWIPFKKELKTLHIAVADPLNGRELEHIKYQLSAFDCLFYVAASSQIEEQFLLHTSEKKQSLADLFIMLDTSSLTLPSLVSAELIPLILDQCLEEAVQERASDIHLEPENKFIQIRLRIDGQLISYHAFHKDFWDSFCVHLKVCAHMNIAENRLPQSGRFSRKINEKEIDFRISTHPTKHGESIVIRVLDRLKALMPLEAIGFPPTTVLSLKETIQDKQGLFIVSGPTGSGKTTTLYSILHYLNTTNRNIMTLEQPIEYELPFIRQTEIQENSILTFANGVRSILRQDPDILFIGEVRDPDTAQMALRASMTGHQVYTTLHAPRALGAIQRLMDLGITSPVLAGNLRGLLSQRLVRRLCLRCRKRRKIAFQETCLIPADSEQFLYDPVGCSVCNQTGYKGRFPLVEFIPCTNTFNQLVFEKAPLSILEKEARKVGYIPLHEHGLKCLLEGVTSFQELCSVISLERDLR